MSPIDYSGFAIPKPPSRLRDRIASKAARDRREAAFRAAVWKRDGGHCRICGRTVKRTLTLCPEQGHVHHLRGRRVAPEDRYNPKAALLACRQCHEAHHDGRVRITP